MGEAHEHGEHSRSVPASRRGPRVPAVDTPPPPRTRRPARPLRFLVSA
ncbi:hypothetical protein HBB16_16535 [Pseudonocardia sp. MCCB 268]|nr:hypothetical protein [Pseudonocardia cytotoxica]